jgi:hypothetical protein
MSNRTTRRAVLGQWASAMGLGLAASTANAAPRVSRTAFARTGPVKSQLTLVLSGGMSSQETFDPKPLGPVDRRGPAGAIATSVPGVCVSSWLPRLAARAHEFTLVRSVTLGSAPATHDAGLALLPAATVSEGDIGSHGDLLVRPVSRSEMRRRATLGTARPTARVRSRQRVGFDYGASRFGGVCQAAVSQLVAGADSACVHFAPTVFDCLSWDMHANGAGLPISLTDYRETLCPQFDQVLCAVFDELQARGLWSTTTVRVVTEVGRSAQFNSRGGRDHARGPFCALLAGGGVAGGVVIGATTADGGEVLEGEVTLGTLLNGGV